MGVVMVWVKKKRSCNWRKFFILNQYGNAKKKVKIWKLKLLYKTSYVMKNTLILAVKDCTILHLIVRGRIKC